MDQPVIDLRSDVFATPTDEMWEAMRSADVGWAYLGQDATVDRLEQVAAEIVGKAAAVFVPTCSMANLVALMTLGERGGSAIVESASHVATTEAAGVTSVGGVDLRTIDGQAGVLVPTVVEEALRASRAAVVCLENSHNNAGGAAITPEQTAAVVDVARRLGAAVHLDGARLFNSAAALGVPPRRLTDGVDAVAFSLNKGLGAPFGAILAGAPAAIDGARANLKRIGAASIHQAGILAAAGLVALTQMLDRLADDNRRAADLARRIASAPSLRADPAAVQTNIVVVDVSPMAITAEQFVERLSHRGVLGYPRPPTRVRFVTHRLIGDAEVDRAATAIAAVAGPGRPLHA